MRGSNLIYAAFDEFACPVLKVNFFYLISLGDFRAGYWNSNYRFLELIDSMHWRLAFPLCNEKGI